jgi:hypothetical protein
LLDQYFDILVNFIQMYQRNRGNYLIDDKAVQRVDDEMTIAEASRALDGCWRKLGLRKTRGVAKSAQDPDHGSYLYGKLREAVSTFPAIIQYDATAGRQKVHVSGGIN